MLKNFLDLEKGILKDYTTKVIRRAGDMVDFYEDRNAIMELARTENPVIYEVYGVVNEGEGQLCYAVTILHPGKVGREYYMTKGHYHKKRDRGEIYITLRGKGLILMQKDENVEWVEMKRGDIVYVPPHWAHRSINTGTEDFVFIAIYPGDAGHDYDTIATKGFKKLVVDNNGKYELIDNPRWS